MNSILRTIYNYFVTELEIKKIIDTGRPDPAPGRYPAPEVLEAQRRNRVVSITVEGRQIYHGRADLVPQEIKPKIGGLSWGPASLDNGWERFYILNHGKVLASAIGAIAALSAWTLLWRQST